MNQFNCGDLVRLKFSSDVFRVVDVLDSGMLKVSTTLMTLITAPEGVKAVDESEGKLPFRTRS